MCGLAPERAATQKNLMPRTGTHHRAVHAPATRAGHGTGRATVPRRMHIVVVRGMTRPAAPRLEAQGRVTRSRHERNERGRAVLDGCSIAGKRAAARHAGGLAARWYRTATKTQLAHLVRKRFGERSKFIGYRSPARQQLRQRARICSRQGPQGEVGEEPFDW